MLSVMLNKSETVLSVSEETFSLYLYPKYAKVKFWNDKVIKNFYNDFLLMNKKSLELYFSNKETVLNRLLSLENRNFGYEEMCKYIHLNFIPLKEKSLINTIIDKQIDYTFHISTLLERFPNSKITVLTRDARDNVEACVRRKMGKSLDICYQATLWNDHYIETLPYLNDSRFLFVKYESLILDSVDTMQRISAHFNIPFKMDMVEHEGGFEELLESQSSKLNEGFEEKIRDFHAGLLSPKNKDKIGAYARVFTQEQILKVNSITSDVSRKLGYSIKGEICTFDQNEKKEIAKAHRDRRDILRLYMKLPVWVKLLAKRLRREPVNA